MDADRVGNDTSLMCGSIFSGSLTAVWDGRREPERQRQKSPQCLNCSGFELRLGRQEKQGWGCQVKQTKQRLRETKGGMTTGIVTTEQKERREIK